MMLRSRLVRTAPKQARDIMEGVRARNKELENSVKSLEEKLRAREEEGEGERRELRAKIRALQEAMHEAEGTHAEALRRLEAKFSKVMEEIRRRLEEADKPRAEGLPQLQHHLQEKRRLIARLHEDARATVASLLQAASASSPQP